MSYKVYASEESVNQKINDNNEQNRIIGTTKEITPTQVAEAITTGKNIAILHPGGVFGNLISNSYIGMSVDNIVLSSAVGVYNGELLAAVLVGDMVSETWTFNTTLIAKKSDIPTTEDIEEIVNNALAKLQVWEGGSY